MASSGKVDLRGGFAAFRKNADAVVRDGVNGTMRGAAKRFGELLVERTPEDEGDAKGNWRASNRTRRRFEEGAEAAEQQPTNEAAIDSTDFMSGQGIVWSNSAPYAWKLEKGFSDQAPRGMLAVTTTEFPGLVTHFAGRRRRGK